MFNIHFQDVNFDSKINMSNETDMRSSSKGGHSSSSGRRKHRSRSTPRHADLEKPRKRRHLSATNSLVSIPNAIKLSMMNSGLISTSKRFPLFFCFRVIHRSIIALGRDRP